MKNKYESSSNSEQTKSSLRRKIWNGEEDAFLDSCVKEQMQKSAKTKSQSRINWKAISDQFINLNSQGKLPYPRSGKQCRERWRNHLIIPIQQEWKNEDRMKLFEYNAIYCNRWAKICKLMGRTENDVKNQYHVSYRKRMTEVLKELNSEKIFPQVYRQATIKKIKYNEINSELVSKLIEDLDTFQNDSEHIESKFASAPEKNNNSPPKKSLVNKIIIQPMEDKKGEVFNSDLSTQRLRLKYSNQSEDDDESNSEKKEVDEESYYYIKKFENFCSQVNREGKIKFSDF